MADGEIDVKYGLDITQAQAELQKLKRELNGLTADFQGTARVIQRNVTKMTRDLRDLLRDPPNNQSIQSIQRKYESAQSRSLSFQAKGGHNAQLMDAAVRSMIAETRSSERMLQARLTDEMVKSSARIMQNSHKAVQARLRLELARVEQMIANSSDSLINANRVLRDRANLRRIEDASNLSFLDAQDSARRRRQRNLIADENNAALQQALVSRRAQSQSDLMYEARHGRAAASMRFTRERFDVNGGADMMGLQGRIMANGMAIATAFQAARGLASFVVQLDKELTNFQAISTATNREMGVMRQHFIDLSATVPFTTLEMAQAATTMAQAGLSAREVSDSLGAVAQFATASGSDLAKSVDIVTSAITAFNLQTSQTGDVANTFTAALNLSKLSVDKLVTAMNYIAPTAASMGMSIDETVSILGALSQSGLRASTMATGARTLIVGLQNPSKKFLEVLKHLGLTQKDVNVQSQGFLTVMERLKAAGFGAAEAYEAFELRGAAAFVALSNNIELAYEMQKAFTLSAAATEATNIQMGSLANTAKNFASVMGGITYQAFSPLVDVLQDSLEGAVSLLSVLNEFPGVLNAIAVAGTLVGTATVFGLFGSLFRGMAGMVPLMATFATNAKGLTGILTGLFAVLRFHPFTAILSTVAAAAVALYSFGNAGEDAAAKMDFLRARVNELKGETDTIEKRMSALDQTMESVVNQKDALDKNPLMREAKIMEIQKQFKELGATIDASTSSVTDLIRELNNLKTADAELRAAATGAQLQAEENLAAEQRRALDDFFRRAVPTDRIGAGLRARQQRNAAGLIDDDNVNTILRLVNGDRSLLRNAPGMQAMGARLSRTLNEMRGQRAGATDDAIIETLENNIRFLENLQQRFNELNTIVQKLASAEQNVDVTSIQNRQASVEATSTFADVRSDITDLEAFARSELNAIESGARGSSVASQIEAKENLKRLVQRRLEGIHALSNKVLKEALENNSNVTRGDVESSMTAEFGKLGPATNDIRASIEASQKSHIEVLDRQFKRTSKVYAKEMRRLADRRDNSLTHEELKAVGDSFEASSVEQAKAIRDLYEKKLRFADSDEEKAQLREELEALLEDAANAFDDFFVESARKSNDILKDSLKSQKENIDDQAKTLKKKIDEVTAMLKIARPGEAVDNLKASLAQMLEAFQRLTGQSNALGFQINAMDFSSTPVPGNAASRADQAMRWLMSQEGVNKNAAAGIVGNLLVESNLNPRAAGDYRSGHPTAFGIAQHRGVRWDNLRSFTGSGNAFDFMSQLAFVLQEARTYPGMLGRMGATSPAEAARIFMQEFERPSSDPSVNHISRRAGHAMALAETDYASQSHEVAEIQKTAGENIVIGVNRAVEDALNARLRAVDQKVDSAQAALSEAQKHPGKYTNVDIMNLEENVRLAERAALLERIKITEEQIAAAQQAQSTTQPGTQEHEDALRRETELKEKLVDLTNQKNLADAATAHQGPSVAQAIQAANVAWAQQQGLMDGRGGIVSAAQQVGAAWTQVLNGLSSGFSTFFKNIVSGTMSAKDAFKQLGLSIVQMFMDIIAKALANQIIMSLFGGGMGGGGIFGALGQGLFGVLGMNTGGGIPGAATGEFITGGTAGRDSVLRKVMPGEYILRASAVKAIGKDNLDVMNATANRQMATGVAPLPEEKPAQTGTVNVWVVSPDQVPPPGPNDIVATVADNIQRRGSLKQLIQQVQLGTI